MKITKEFIQEIEPNFDHIEESPIIIKGQTLGWHVNSISKNSIPLGSGANTSRKIANVVAISETLERALIKQIMISKYKSDFFLDTNPSSCGFAFGFNDDSTKMRSVFEAIERWVLSKWIDESYHIEEFKAFPMSSFATNLLSNFVEIKQWSKCFELPFLPTKEKTIYFNFSLGLTENGAFPGSCVSFNQYDWDHAFIETWRHWLINKNLGNHPIANNVFGRIKYFAENKKHALDQISKAKAISWESPRLKFIKKYEHSPSGTYLYRSLCADYLSWTEGGVDRFVF